MYCTNYRWLSWLFICTTGFLLMSATTHHSNPVKKRYQIASGSRLYLKGTSNVNSFTCDCDQQYQEQTLEIDRNGGYARFKNVDLAIPVKRFDCHNRKIDHDMQKALKADQYPHIRIALVDTRQNAQCLDGNCKDWFDVQARVKITIGPSTKEQPLAGKARKIGPRRFQLRGEQALQMSAFGIDPPEAMFGLIKVDDWITFHFDLLIDIGELQ